MSVYNTMLTFSQMYQIIGILKFLRSTNSTIGYVPLAKIFGMFSGGSDLARILGLIQDEDLANGDPLHASLVVGAALGIPGKGYFVNARQLGLLGQPSSNAVQNAKDELLFWASQMKLLGVSYPAAAIVYAGKLGVTLP